MAWPVTTPSQGKRFDMARDSTLQTLPAGMVSAGLAKDSSVQDISAQTWSASGLATQATALNQLAGITATNTQLGEGVAPSVPNYNTGDQILQAPGGSPYTLLTASGNGRIWAAEVSASIGSSGGVGTNHVYARVYTSGGKTLAIVELCVEGNPDKDSGSVVVQFTGAPISSGASILLDVNGGVTVAGTTLRASGLAGISVP